jgi:RNA polymerase sigma factor for flagellar operon FliA
MARSAAARSSRASATVVLERPAAPLTLQPKPTQAGGVTPKPASSRIVEDVPEDIWLTYKRTRDQNIRNSIIERHMPLVRVIAERLLQTLPKSIELDDLTSAGTFGLMDAIDGFDVSRGIKFKTYCTTRIRGSILDELRSQDWVPRLVRLKAHRLERALR